MTLDDARATRALELLKEVAADFQVIYLTTSDRYDALADRVVALDGPTAADGHVEPEEPAPGLSSSPASRSSSSASSPRSAGATGDFGGGPGQPARAAARASSRVTQLVGALAALALAVAARRAVPAGPDIGLGGRGRRCAALVGITSLYRGLAVGRMGVVAPTTGVLSAVDPGRGRVPLEGVPQPAASSGSPLALSRSCS